MRPSDAQNSYGELMQLAVSASSIVGGMVIPGLIGWYIDRQLGTQFCVLLGLGLGVVVGTIQLLALAKRGSKKKQADEDPDRDAGT
ncbi:hypothetical protein NA78x_004194 [Anatilimnocola sp. NA78]|uniref:hypothetical protein n=1 Tax=Anatilimnocola sp. NA78 TaxID=3415683 RepID=UPI003CE56E8F